MNEFVLHAVPAAVAVDAICLLLHLANNAYLGSRGCRRRRLREVYSAAIHFGVPNFYSVPNSGAEYCDERVCLCVCVFVCPRSVCSELHVRSSPNFFAHITCGRGSVLLWRRSDTLRTSGFMDDVIFAQKPRLLDVAAQLKRSAHAALGLVTNCAQ